MAKYFMNFLRLSVGQMTIHMCRRSGNYQESQERAVRQIWTTVGTAIKIVRAVMTTWLFTFQWPFDGSRWRPAGGPWHRCRTRR